MSFSIKINTKLPNSPIPYILSAAIDIFNIVGYILRFSEDNGFTVVACEDTDWRIFTANSKLVVLQYQPFPESRIIVDYTKLDDGDTRFNLYLEGISKFNNDLLDTIDDYTFSCVNVDSTIKEEDKTWEQ